MCEFIQNISFWIEQKHKQMNRHARGVISNNNTLSLKSPFEAREHISNEVIFSSNEKILIHFNRKREVQASINIRFMITSMYNPTLELYPRQENEKTSYD